VVFVKLKTKDGNAYERGNSEYNIHRHWLTPWFLSLRIWGTLWAQRADFLSAGIDNASVSAAPLPAALPLFGSGVMMLAGVAWRRRGKVSSQ
jgi:hypothetical protein